VPAIIGYPGKLPQGAVRDQIITVMDWYPTVLELCGIEREVDAPMLDGHNFLPIIESAESPSGYEGVLHFQWGKKWAVREGDWKLIGIEGKSKVTLHRLTDDKPETIDHAEEKTDLVQRLKTLHRQWAEEVTPRS